MNLSNKHFELVENTGGHASAKTVMRFDERVQPFVGTYTGPNTVHGQVIVYTKPSGMTDMLYQSLTTDGELVAGRAEVSLIESGDNPLVMKLQWQWLTGSLSSGTSTWQEIAVDDF